MFFLHMWWAIFLLWSELLQHLNTNRYVHMAFVSGKTKWETARQIELLLEFCVMYLTLWLFCLILWLLCTCPFYQIVDRAHIQNMTDSMKSVLARKQGSRKIHWEEIEFLMKATFKSYKIIFRINHV